MSEKTAAPPYVQFYPRDFMDGVMHWSADLRGCYISLLCFQWTAKHVPGDDVAQLRNIMGVATNAAAMKAWQVIQVKFTRQADGRWLNARLEAERVKADAFVASQRAKGALGGRPKKNPGDNPGQNPRVTPRDTPRQSPGVTHPDPVPSTGTTVVQGSKIHLRSTDHSQKLFTETSTPSEAQSSAAGITRADKGWEIWLLVKGWIAQHGGASLVSFSDRVYAATATHGRLELIFDDTDVARYFLTNWSGLLSDAMAAVGHPDLQVRAIARLKPALAKAKVG